MDASYCAVGMAIGIPMNSLWNLGHPDGDDSPKCYVLLVLTSPGVGFDFTKVSRDLESQGPVAEVVQSFNLPSEHFDTPD